MSKPLTKYSVPQALTQDRTTHLNKAVDTQSPYSYQEWIVRNIGIVPGREFVLYNLYLKAWYKTRTTKITSSNLVKQHYKSLLQEIAVVFKDDLQENVWLNNVDLDNDEDLETVIPFYARKLKEIALYLATKRDVVKQAKLKYNMVGAVQAMEHLFYNYFLNAFTKKQSTLGVTDLATWSKFPALSTVRKDFDLQIEELFDDEEYFDKNPAIASSKYFNLSSDANINYYNAINFPVSALDWLYQTGFAYTSANNSLTWTESGELVDNNSSSLVDMPVSAFELEDNQTLNTYNYFDLSDTYLGENQWIASGGYHIPRAKTYTYNIVAGNNWFYWPSGEYFNEAETGTKIDPILLSKTDFTKYGTGGTDYTNSDVIFVYKNNKSEGAWLKLWDYVTQYPVMSAILEPNSRTTFKFPWPGMGISGVDVPWTGKSLSNRDKAFDYLDTDLKREITTTYWSEGDTIHKIAPILLNDTTLVAYGAKAASNYIDADKITVRLPTSGSQFDFNAAQDANPDGIYTSKQQYAWLYKLDTTQIPIAAGETNQILWPFERLSTTTSDLSAHSPTTCNNITLSSLDAHYVFSGSTAGSTLANSDIIIKQNAFGSTITKMAWLSGRATSTLNSLTPGVSAGSLFNGTIQAGWLNFKAEAGTYVTFIWTGPNNANINNYIHWHDHSDDCPYKVLQQTLPLLERDVMDLNVDIGARRWDLCTCRAFHYSPMGHSGEITDYYGVHDFICEDFDYPTSFDLGDYRDKDGHIYTNSPYFAWYKTTATGMGYGPGAFETTDSIPSYLALLKGHIYRYYRTNLKRSAANFSVPYLVVRAPSTGGAVSYPEEPKWIKAKQQSAGNFVSTGKETDMTLRPGDVISYYHANPEKQLDDYTVQQSGINFLISAPLVNGKPYWAQADDSMVETASKGTPVYGNTVQIVDDYVQYTQPPASDISLTNDMYFEYARVGASLVWFQQIALSTLVNVPQWNKLLASTKLTPWDDFIGAVSALNLTASQTVASTILLEPLNSLKPVLINYYARNAFTFTQELSDSTYGVPPDGGTWITPVSSAYVIPTKPYANLTNRHFPTVATVQNLTRLQSMSEMGGYFIPKNLGALTYFGKHFKTGWNTD